MIGDANACLVCVTHPVKGADISDPRRITVDCLAGGAAIGRFVQTVLWLHYHREVDEHLCRTSAGTARLETNRSLWALKARSGGQNRAIGMWFDRETLRQREVGLITEW